MVGGTLSFPAPKSRRIPNKKRNTHRIRIRTAVGRGSRSRRVFLRRRLLEGLRTALWAEVDLRILGSAVEEVRLLGFCEELLALRLLCKAVPVLCLLREAEAVPAGFLLCEAEAAPAPCLLREVTLLFCCAPEVDFFLRFGVCPADLPAVEFFNGYSLGMEWEWKRKHART